jgi:gamma-glutamylcyclotransferase (GGCT)/AIG2-like uncharacterized protein YtfP
LSSSSQLPFFVYGTLLPGQPNYHLWGGAIRSERAAFLPNSRLYDMALLNLGHYPMLVEEQGKQVVVGMLVEVEPGFFDAVLRTLDLLEDYRPGRPNESYYHRAKRIIASTNGHQHVAWVYLGRPGLVVGLEPIPGGNWKAYCANRKAEVDGWWSAGGRVPSAVRCYDSGQPISSAWHCPRASQPYVAPGAGFKMTISTGGLPPLGRRKPGRTPRRR